MKKPKLFYGWFIVGAGVLLLSYNSIIAYGFTAFINPIAATFGWSYAQISLAMSLRGMEAGALNPFVGFAVDRWSARKLVLAGILIFAGGLVFLSRISNLAMFYLGFITIGLGISLFAHMVPPTLVARWFRKDLGKASGILALGNGIGALAIPLLVLVMDRYGWQNAFLFLAGGILVMGVPLAFVFRNRPEDYGMLPDGEPVPETNGIAENRQPQAPAIEITVKDAFKLREFWHISLAMCLQMVVWGGVITYMMPYMTSFGISRASASMITMVLPLSSLAGRLGFGFLTDIYKSKNVWVFSAFILMISVVILWRIDGPSYVLLTSFSILFGVGISGFIPLRTKMIQEYFGIRNFGSILGILSIFTTAGQIVSPPLVGLVYGKIGIYNPIWLVLIGVMAAAGLIMWTAPDPKPLLR